MTDLWFDREFATVSRWGGMLWASHPSGVWAVMTQNLVYPDDIGLESGQLLGHFGGAVIGIGALLLDPWV